MEKENKNIFELSDEDLDKVIGGVEFQYTDNFNKDIITVTNKAPGLDLSTTGNEPSNNNGISTTLENDTVGMKF